MTIKSISYSKTIPTGPYMNEKIGIEADLGENESPEEALTKASMLIDKWHRESNPQLYQPTIEINGMQLPADYMNVSNITIAEPSIGLSKEAIQSCKDIVVLEMYFPLIDRLKDEQEKRELWLAYDERFEQLNKQTTA